MKRNEGFSTIFLILFILLFIVTTGFILAFKGPPNTEIIKSNEQLEKKSDMTEIEWQNLKLIIKDGSFNAPTKLSLSLMGHLNSNEFSSVDSYQLAAYPSADTFELVKPIKMVYDLDEARTMKIIDECEFDINTLSFYTNKEVSSSQKLNATEKLETLVDLENNKLIAELPSLGDHQQYGVFTDIVIGAKPTKYLSGCGENAQAFLEEGYVIYKDDNYKFKMPDGFGRPQISRGLVNNRVNLIPQEKNYVPIQVISQHNWQELPVSELDSLKHSGYERMEPTSFFEGEEIISKQNQNLGGKQYLEVESTDGSNKTYRLLTTYRNQEYAYVLVIEVKEKTDESGLYKYYMDVAKEVAATVEEL